jgi:hypothetical protein
MKSQGSSPNAAMAYAPAAGKLAAAMATIWANRRPIRDDAKRKNEFTCRMTSIPYAGAEHFVLPAYGKWSRPKLVSRVPRK